MPTYLTRKYAKLSKLYPESYEGSLGGSLGNFWPNGASGCQLASVGPRKLIKMINYFILSMGMGFWLF